MDEHQKEAAKLLFDVARMKLSEDGYVEPLFFMLLADGILQPIIVPKEMKISLESYATGVISAAHTASATGVALLCELETEEETYLTFIHVSDTGETEALAGKIYRDKNVPYVLDYKWTTELTTSLITPWKLPEEILCSVEKNKIFREVDNPVRSS